MIYKHRVKRNGIYYEAGQDVPDAVPINEDNTNNESEDSNLGNEQNPIKRGRPRKA